MSAYPRRREPRRLSDRLPTRLRSCFAYFSFYVAAFLVCRLVILPVCRTLSVAALTSGVSVARALSQPLHAAALALTAAGCILSTAAETRGPTVALVS